MPRSFSRSYVISYVDSVDMLTHLSEWVQGSEAAQGTGFYVYRYHLRTLKSAQSF